MGIYWSKKEKVNAHSFGNLSKLIMDLSEYPTLCTLNFLFPMTILKKSLYWRKNQMIYGSLEKYPIIVSLKELVSYSIQEKIKWLMSHNRLYGNKKLFMCGSPITDSTNDGDFTKQVKCTS